MHTVDGNVYLYDLAARQRLIRPVAQLQVASSSYSSQDTHSRSRGSGHSNRHGGMLCCGVNALAYNSVFPSTLAAAAGDQVKVRAKKVAHSVTWVVLCPAVPEVCMGSLCSRQHCPSGCSSQLHRVQFATAQAEVRAEFHGDRCTCAAVVPLWSVA